MMKRYLAGMTAFLAILMLGSTGLAAGGNRMSINFYDRETDGALPGADFRLYRIGERTDGGYELTGDFAGYPVDISGIDWSDAGSVAELAGTISDLIALDDAEPVFEGMTDRDGHVLAVGLEDGLYVLTGDVLEVADGNITTSYMPQPILQELPYYQDGGDACSGVELDVKYDKTTETEETINVTVVKVWKGDGSHPDSITVTLLDNGEEYDKAQLNEENGWKHTWEGLDASHSFRVAETDVPDGYTVAVAQDGNGFTVTNTAKGTPSPTPTPAPTEKPKQPTPASQTPAPAPAPEKPKLPQTGQLWWPVIALLASGLALFVCGMVVLMCFTDIRTKMKELAGRIVGLVTVLFGLSAVIIGLSLSVVNIHESDEAGDASQAILEELESIRDDSAQEDTVSNGGSIIGWPVAVEIPEEVPEEGMDGMTAVELDGRTYIGIIAIPSIEVELPVQKTWSLPQLKVSPCRYVGSPYGDSFVICAHNYASHFGRIKNLVKGDEVAFSDMDGNEWRYVVEKVETLGSTDIEGMTDSEWDLTLFTCTIGGQSRVTVRCRFIE